jgi:hypothetical protein
MNYHVSPSGGMNIQSPPMDELSLLDLMDYRNKEMSRTEIWVHSDPIPPGAYLLESELPNFFHDNSG